MIGFLIAGAAAVVAAALVWWYRSLRERGRIASMAKRTAAGAALFSWAQLIDGSKQVSVALSLREGRLKYQNAEVDGSIDVHDIDEIEYVSDLMTGSMAAGAMLRVRSHGHAFEFALDVATAERWCHSLPPHRLSSRKLAGWSAR